MSRDTEKSSARDALGESRQPVRGAWLIRAVALAYLLGNGIVAYLVFTSG